jgi:hypothetical protein
MELDQAFRTIKPVADRTVACVMAEMPEIGLLLNKAVSKLAGLAPLARDSGKMQGKRPVRGGRRNVRAVLFVVASVVRRHDPDFAAFQQRLSAAGKPKKVIRIALAHKLLVRLNAKAREVREASQQRALVKWLTKQTVAPLRGGASLLTAKAPPYRGLSLAGTGRRKRQAAIPFKMTPLRVGSEAGDDPAPSGSTPSVEMFVPPLPGLRLIC